jgi:hypothetical protein
VIFPADTIFATGADMGITPGDANADKSNSGIVSNKKKTKSSSGNMVSGDTISCRPMNASQGRNRFARSSMIRSWSC